MDENRSTCHLCCLGWLRAEANMEAGQDSETQELQVGCQATICDTVGIQAKRDRIKATRCQGCTGTIY